MNDNDFLKNFFDNFVSNMTDDEKRQKIVLKITFIAFAIIALVMSVINIITQKHILLIATASFCILCFIDWFLAQKSDKTCKIASFMFAVEVIILFSYFIATGGTDNFSIVWVLLLPTLGLFFFGMKYGTIVCAITLSIMLAIFYVPGLKEITTDYGTTFTTRFPVVFLSSYFVSVLLEAVRFFTARELNELRKKYQNMYIHDPLTGLFNRYGLQKTLESVSEDNNKKIAISIFDIDYFKNVNDTYGHECGDYVLKELSVLVLNKIPQSAVLHRWGGEEFLTVYSDPEDAFNNAQILCDSVRDHNFVYRDKVLHITISIGIIECDSLSVAANYDGLISIADDCLYQAKQSGRDRVVSKAI